MPKFETSIDEHREHQARLLVQSLTGLTLKKFQKPYSQIDWAVLSRFYDEREDRHEFKLRAYAELKGNHKGTAHVQKKGFVLGLDKWLHLKNMSRNTALPFWLIYAIRTTEEKTNYLGVFWHDTPHGEIIQGGRFDRGIESDVDFIVRLPFHYFTPFNTKEDGERIKDRLLRYPLEYPQRED